MKTDKYKDLKIGQRVWFNSNDDEFPVYVPIIIDDIFPPNRFDDGYIYGTTDDETREKYKLYFEDIVVEKPEEKYQKTTENDLDNSSEILHITKKQFNELLKEVIMNKHSSEPLTIETVRKICDEVVKVQHEIDLQRAWELFQRHATYIHPRTGKETCKMTLHQFVTQMEECDH